MKTENRSKNPEIQKIFEDEGHKHFTGLRRLVRALNENVDLQEFYKILIANDYFHKSAKEEILLPEYRRRIEALIKIWTEP